MANCRGCGVGNRMLDHCNYPSKRGPEITDPKHPSNTGAWATIVELVNGYLKK